MKEKHSRHWFSKVKAKFFLGILENVHTGAIVQLRLRVRLNSIGAIMQLITLGFKKHRT